MLGFQRKGSGAPTKLRAVLTEPANAARYLRHVEVLRFALDQLRG
jgi:hypothetical protein